jgi:hypothetical protein
MRNRRNQRGRRRNNRTGFGSTGVTSRFTSYTQFQTVSIVLGSNGFSYSYSQLTGELSGSVRSVRIKSVVVRFYPIGPVTNTGPVAVQLLMFDPTTITAVPVSVIRPLDYNRATTIRARPNFSQSGFWPANNGQGLLYLEVKSPAVTTLSWDIECTFYVARDTLF